MDKLVMEMIALLRELVEAYGRLLATAEARRDAMRTFDTVLLTKLLAREHDEIVQCQKIEVVRTALVEKFKQELGKNITPNTTEIARRCREPMKSQVLVLAAQLRETMEKLDRCNRINHRASQAVASAIGRVMRAVTGLAQHAGLYMRNGRKSAVRGANLLDVAG